MKQLLALSILLAFIFSCKEDKMDPITPEPTPTYHTFEGDIGVNDNSTVVTADDNLLLCGNSQSNISLLKVSKTGSQAWRNNINAGDGSTASSLTQAGNDDLFICGSTYRNELYSKIDVLLIKTNSAGDTLWTKTYGGSQDDYGEYIITTADGNLLICGSAYGYPPDGFSNIYLIKVNLAGDTIWTKRYPELSGEYPRHLLQTLDGDYLVTGRKDDTIAEQSRVYFLKVGADGNQLWTKTINSGFESSGLSTIEEVNRNLITCGKIVVGPASQILLMATDAFGNELWSEEYGETFFAEQGNALAVNADGTYTITGGSIEEHSGQRGIVLLKVDKFRKQLFLKDFGHALIDYGQNVIKDEHDGNIITGEYGGKMFMTRTDKNGVFK